MRTLLVAKGIALPYHIVSKCVRGLYLCGKDKKRGKDYSARKKWIVQRIQHLAQCFAVEVCSYAIMDNHFHLLVIYDPLACKDWSDEEVAHRWIEAFPPVRNGVVLDTQKSVYKAQLLGNKALLKKRGEALGSLSSFMKHVNYYIACRANKEDGVKGHFFDGRFYSGALLTEEAMIACMAYIDLNPLRAKIVKIIQECRYTSCAERLDALSGSKKKLNAFLKPLVSGLDKRTHKINLTLKEYIVYLQDIIETEQRSTLGHISNKARRWFDQIASFKRKQRAYGSTSALQGFAVTMGFKRPGRPLPV